MSIKKVMQDALNAQINAEIYSSYLYYSMSAWYESHGLPGFAHWMRLQAIEEMSHADKLVHFLNNRGGQVLLGAIEAPDVEWASPLAVFEATCAHEAYVTTLINELVDLAMRESDHATYQFLQWYVTEQVEEEATADEVLQKMKLVEGAKGALFMLDRDMSARAIAMPQGTV